LDSKVLKKFHRYLVEPRCNLGSFIIAGLPTEGWLGLHFPISTRVLLMGREIPNNFPYPTNYGINVV